MYEAPYELGSAADGYLLRIRARGRSVLTNPLLNRGTAFTPEQRQMLGLQGLLPSGVSTLEGQPAGICPIPPPARRSGQERVLGQHA